MEREGGFVPIDDDTRRSILLNILPYVIMVGSEILPPNLGFTHDEALRNSQAFVNELYNLSQKIDKQLLAVYSPGVSDTTDLDEALHVSQNDAILTLFRLRKIGAALRAELSHDILEKLDYHGFHFCGQKNPEKMALTFQEMNKAPILWEMLYETEEEQSSFPEWQRFWGFGVPITHWADISRIEEIRLRNGFFSAVHEGLPFAKHEEQAIKGKLQQRLQRDLPHYSLRQELYHAVQQAIQQRLCDLDKTETWWKTCPDDFWLRRFLEEMEPDHEARQYCVPIWKEDILLAICKRGFTQELIHFACHCEPDERTEFLSRLIMQVAGEEIPLDVAMLVTKMKVKKTTFNDPGSLVFLNACGTAQAVTMYEPPGFPMRWIKDQRALAVIATLCPVPDYFAHAFALKFYEILFATGETVNANATRGIAANQYIATALLEARRYFMEKYNNPLGLAYTLYAVKDAHIQIDSFQREGRTV